MIKNKDLPGLILLIGVSVIVSYLVSNALFGKQKLVSQVEVVDPISAEFNYENKPYFNDKALNPTKNITVNENTNQNPLGQ